MHRDDLAGADGSELAGLLRGRLPGDERQSGCGNGEQLHGADCRN
jgi:hypothetical protein